MAGLICPACGAENASPPGQEQFCSFCNAPLGDAPQGDMPYEEGAQAPLASPPHAAKARPYVRRGHGTSRRAVRPGAHRPRSGGTGAGGAAGHARGGRLPVVLAAVFFLVCLGLSLWMLLPMAYRIPPTAQNFLTVMEERRLQVGALPLAEGGPELPPILATGQGYWAYSPGHSAEFFYFSAPGGGSPPGWAEELLAQAKAPARDESLLQAGLNYEVYAFTQARYDSYQVLARLGDVVLWARGAQQDYELINNAMAAFGLKGLPVFRRAE